jgi:hypothetical protein
MKFIAKDNEVIQEFGRGERNTVATCLNLNWARTIAKLLQEDWETAR